MYFFFDFYFFFQMFDFNLSSLIVVFSGVFVSLLYRNKLLSMDTVDFIPPPLSCFLTSNSNFFGSMINKFTNFGEIASNVNFYSFLLFYK